MSPATATAFHVLAKPSGALCNLDCMSDTVLESYIRQQIELQPSEATIAWQGGEPTLMGLEFFRHATELTQRYRRPGQHVQHTLQTNGALIDEEWCVFLREHNFLVGLGIDGPRALQDAYGVDERGRPTFAKAERAARLMQQLGVEFTVLCTVHAQNADHPLEVYRCFRDELRARFIQFIPIVERVNCDDRTFLQQSSAVTERSVKPEAWGRFLNAVFDEWVRRDVGIVFVQMFDAALASWVGAPHGRAKRDALPRYCRECSVRFACQGECPKNRFTLTPDGEPGLNYLCGGYRAFFTHIDGPMRTMADLLRQGRCADAPIPGLRSGHATEKT